MKRKTQSDEPHDPKKTKVWNFIKGGRHPNIMKPGGYAPAAKYRPPAKSFSGKKVK